jgi:hypothetical protein
MNSLGVGKVPWQWNHLIEALAHNRSCINKKMQEIHATEETEESLLA